MLVGAIYGMFVWTLISAFFMLFNAADESKETQIGFTRGWVVALILMVLIGVAFGAAIEIKSLKGIS